MCAPPKIAVFTFVLTIHLAILAFAFPRLDLSDPVQHTATSSAAHGISDEPESKSESSGTTSADGQPPAAHQPRTSPAQHHRHEQRAAGQHADDMQREPAAPHDLHQHSLAESTSDGESRHTELDSEPEAATEAESEPSAKTKTADHVADTTPAQAKPSAAIAVTVSEDPVAVASADTAAAAKSVTLTKAEPPEVSTDAVSMPKPPTAAPPRPTTTTTSTRAGSDRMSNLRPLKAGSR